MWPLVSLKHLLLRYAWINLWLRYDVSQTEKYHKVFDRESLNSTNLESDSNLGGASN